MTINESQIQFLIFSTSIQHTEDIDRISDVINAHPKILRWHVDLEDWEKVLCVEATDISTEEIITMLRQKGIFSREIE